MRKFAFIALSIAGLGLTLTGCASRYYDDRYGYYDGYSRDHYAYSDRDRDRDGIPNRYDRDRDNDGVPNYADRSPNNPYRN
jgi:hypothetical protein